MSLLSRVPVVRWFSNPWPSVCVEFARAVDGRAVSRAGTAIVTGHAMSRCRMARSVPASTPRTCTIALR
jgi:hypothetical protein